MSVSRSSGIGAGVLVLANVVALSGAGYNRAGQPESKLVLSERELSLFNATSIAGRENTGLSVRIDWCANPADRPRGDEDVPAFPGRCYEHTPAWFDRGKLASLGFDLELAARERGAAEFYSRQSPRHAYVVLELNGAAYETMLASYRSAARATDSSAALRPDSLLEKRAVNARNALAVAERRMTRLFAVDAGPELAALRAKYPNRTRFAIMHATVQPVLVQGARLTVLGQISDVEPGRIHVPKQFRRAFEGLASRPYWEPLVNGQQPASREITIALGKRLEPWVVSATVRGR
jgi:hypothetical protein